MSIFQDYKQYKQYEPQYEFWKNRKDLNEAKRLEYLKQNPINEKTKNEEIQRGKALLRAIDIMDEYSQSRAENMEVATQNTISAIGMLVNMGTLFGCIGLTMLKPVKNAIKSLAIRYPKIGYAFMYLPSILGILSSMGFTMCLQGWAASKEVGASRKGRFEAMKNELSDAKNFAVLTDEQIEKQNEIASQIQTTKDMEKGASAKKANLLNPKDLFKVLKDMMINDKKYQTEREEFDKNLHKGEDNNVKLSEKDILNAKKDQQLLNNIVEKIDMASQDYAENVELATQSFLAIALAGGGLTGWISKQIIKGLKIKSGKLSMIMPYAIGGIVAVGSAIWASSVQKQASRVGRYLAKKEIENNTNNFIYVDEDKTQNITNLSVPQKEKPNFFKFMIQVIKDNIEYKKYTKTQGIENIKKAMALKDIEITPEQEKAAQMLQKNTFKTFNKLDEKSQQYAESVEAVGEVLNAPIALAGSICGMGIGALIGKMIMKSSKSFAQPKMIIPTIIGTLLGIIPSILLNIHFTKEQKQASRVAHMLAINEMHNYKNYVDYANLTSD